MTRRMSPWSVAVALMLGATATISTAQIARAQDAPAAGNPQPAAPAQQPAAPAPPPPPQMAPPPNMRPMRPGMGQPMMPPPPPPAKPLIGPPGVAATVNGQNISEDAVRDMAYKTQGPRVIDTMITNLIIDQEAKKQHLTATPADITAKINEMRQQVKGQFPGQSLEVLVVNSGHTMDELRDNLKTRVELEKLVGKDLKAPRAVHVRHILIRTENVGAPDPNTKVHTEAEAKDILTKIRADLKAGKSFADEAKEYTEDPSGKANGGDLPIVLPNSPLDPAFLEASLKLKKGEVTQEPVKSVYGLHLIECDSTSEDPTPVDKPLFEQAQSNYKTQQLSMQIQTYVQTLKAKAKIANYIATGAPAKSAPAAKSAPKKAAVAPADKKAPKAH